MQMLFRIILDFFQGYAMFQRFEGLSGSERGVDVDERERDAKVGWHIDSRFL